MIQTSGGSIPASCAGKIRFRLEFLAGARASPLQTNNTGRIVSHMYVFAKKPPIYAGTGSRSAQQTWRQMLITCPSLVISHSSKRTALLSQAEKQLFLIHLRRAVLILSPLPFLHSWQEVHYHRRGRLGDLKC
jgi:hypothetical protein